MDSWMKKADRFSAKKDKIMGTNTSLNYLYHSTWISKVIKFCNVQIDITYELRDNYDKLSTYTLQENGSSNLSRYL